MRNVTICILVGLITVVVSLAITATDVTARPSPCEELAALNNEADRLREDLDRLEDEIPEAWARMNEAMSAYADRCSELGVPPFEPDYLRARAEYFRSIGEHETADLYEAAADELQDEYEAADALRVAWGELLLEQATAGHRLWIIRERRPGLMVECGVVTEDTSPTDHSSVTPPFEGREPGPRPPLPRRYLQMLNPMAEENAQPAENGTPQTDFQAAADLNSHTDNQSPNTDQSDSPRQPTLRRPVHTVPAGVTLSVNNPPAANGSTGEATITTQMGLVQQQGQNTNNQNGGVASTHMALPQIDRSVSQGQSQPSLRARKGVARTLIQLRKPLRVNIRRSKKR